MKMNYTPNPIITAGNPLPAELEPLVEEMAKNVHEIWAQSRMEQGWTYGKERNDLLKKHPSLIPYEELTEEERSFDRNTAIGTLNFILNAGFNISR